MFKFLHAADLHLDSPLHGLERYDGAPVEEIRGATRRALDNLVQLAIDEETRFVLIAGDLYDGDWRDYNTGLFFISRLAKLREAGIAVYAVTGNHDAANKMTRSLRIADNPDGTPVMLSHRKPQTIVLPQLDVAIHGQGFASATIEESVVPDYPAARAGHFNIGILHTSLDDSSGLHARYAPCTLGDLAAKGYQYWALGHIHQRHTRQCDGAPVVFPGNIQGRHIRETGPKGCMVVTVDDRGAAQAEFRPLDVLRWEKCEVDGSGAASGEEIVERFSHSLSGLIAANEGLPLAVRVEVAGTCPAHQRLLADLVAWTNELRAAALDAGQGAVWIEKVKWRTSPPRSLDAQALAEGPVAELVGLIRELQEHDDCLKALGDGLFEELQRKLPDDLQGEQEGVRLSDPLELRAALDEVQSMLLARLQSQGAGT
jgi:DNA repair exonuclease SbcCD nuclease subunit